MTLRGPKPKIFFVFGYIGIKILTIVIALATIKIKYIKVLELAVHFFYG